MFLSEPTARAALRPSSTRERRIALAVAVVVSASLLAWAAFGATALPYSAQFFAAYVTALGFGMLFGALLLIFRARLVGDGSATLIAAAFVYTVPVLIVYGLTFPGLAAAWMWRPASSAWFSFAWKMGWASALAVYAWRPRTRTGRLGAATLVALAASIVTIVVILSGALPSLRPAPGVVEPLGYVVNAAAVIAIVVALAGLLRRRRAMTTLDTWMAVALTVLLTGATLLCFSQWRFSTTADAVRMANLLATLIVAASLVYEFQRLLARSSQLERFMTMAEFAPTIVYLLDAQGSCTYVNPRWVDVTGQPAQDAIGRGWADVVHPDDLARNLEIVDRSLSTHAAHSVEMRYRCADGSYRWFLASATPTFDANGAVDGWYGVATDIDSQRRALDEAQRLEHEAAERENDVRRIAETIPLMAWTATPDGDVDWMNQRWCTYTGQSFEETMAWGWAAATHPDEREMVSERWMTSVRTRTPYDVEYRLRGVDGTYRWFLTRAQPIVDDTGNVIKWYGTCTDMDEQRRQSDQLAALYAREHALAETLQSAFIPPFLPQVDGLAFAAVYRPALHELELGGDWYDAFVLPDGRIAMSIGDVAGHGIDAAIAMVRVRETIRAISGFVDTDPGAILELVDRGFVATHPESLATAAFAFYDPATHRFTFARAGHPAPVLLRDGVAALLDAEPGPPLGVDVDSRYVTTTHVLQPGDSIVFYTDGLLEMERDVIGGERRFLAMLERHGNDVEMLVDETLAGSQRDDVALLRLTVVETDVTSWRFQSDDASGADDSRFAFASHLRRRIADDAAIAAAELVFGELIGNVVRHAPGPIEIELAWRGGTPLLIVRDRGPQFTLSDASLPADPLAEGGRGLYLVEQFASMPVVMPRFGGGNEVIVALPVAEAVNDYGKYVPSGAA